MADPSLQLDLGPFTLVIDADETAVLDELASLFAAFPETSARASAHRLQIVSDPQTASDDETNGVENSRYRATFDGQAFAGPVDRNQLMLAVSRKLNRAVLDAEPDVLHLHAGAVRNDHAVVLVIGDSFAGKSTLVAKLVAEGWRYLSDEQVGVTPQGEILSFPRPITLRRGSWPLFEHLDPGALDNRSTSTLDRVEVAPAALGVVDRDTPSLPTLIICPDASSESTYVKPLTVAETVELFVSESLDLERAADAGIDAMLALASAAPGFRVHGKDLETKVREITELARKAVPPGEVVDQGVVALDERSERVAATASWLFADASAALYEPVSGALVRLDESGYRTWQMLGEPEDQWPDGLARSGFVRELRDAGVLSISARHDG